MYVLVNCVVSQDNSVCVGCEKVAFGGVDFFSLGTTSGQYVCLDVVKGFQKLFNLFILNIEFSNSQERSRCW